MTRNRDRNQAFFGFGRKFEDCDPAWRQQQKLLANGPNLGNAAGPIQCVVEGTRIVQRGRPVVQGLGLYGEGEKKKLRRASQLIKHPLRIRIVGDVGAGG